MSRARRSGTTRSTSWSCAPKNAATARRATSNPKRTGTPNSPVATSGSAIEEAPRSSEVEGACIAREQLTFLVRSPALPYWPHRMDHVFCRQVEPRCGHGPADRTAADRGARLGHPLLARAAEQGTAHSKAVVRKAGIGGIHHGVDTYEGDVLADNDAEWHGKSSLLSKRAPRPARHNVRKGPGHTRLYRRPGRHAPCSRNRRAARYADAARNPVLGAWRLDSSAWGSAPNGFSINSPRIGTYQDLFGMHGGGKKRRSPNRAIQSKRGPAPERKPGILTTSILRRITSKCRAQRGLGPALSATAPASCCRVSHVHEQTDI